MLRIDLTPLELGVHEFERTPEAEDVGLDPDQFHDVQVHIRLHVDEQRVVAQFTAEGTAALTCDRTLAPFEERVAGEFTVVFLPPDRAERRRERGEVDDREEVRAWSPSDRSIDLAEPVRDTLMLALPRRRIAPGAEEVDLQTTYGAPDADESSSIDPRWEALKALRDEDAD